VHRHTSTLFGYDAFVRWQSPVGFTKHRHQFTKEAEEPAMSKNQTSVTRRALLKNAAAPAAAAFLLPQTGWDQQPAGMLPGSAPAVLHLPVLSQPDLVFAFVGDVEAERYSLSRSGSSWTGSTRAAGVRVDFLAGTQRSNISLESAILAVQRIHLRWKCCFSGDVLALGDAWERSYGDLEWRPLQAERALPWYTMLHSKERTVGMGIKTGAASFAFWQVDPSGISLWLDTRNGGNGARLGNRTLEMATIVTHDGASGESAFTATQRLCRALTEGTKRPGKRGVTSLDVIYGSNDWYYAYGNNTHDGILRDADLVRSLAPAKGDKPFTVIDDGYQDRSRFPSLPKLAADIRSRDVIPGIWIRPMRAPATTASTLLLPATRWRGRASEQAPLAYDPTIPDALEAIASVATEACKWGFDLIKHDFTTFELLGQWGSQMGASPTHGNWHFNDRTLTNAEIITALYRRLRASCGEERVILGCNTIGHLSVGLFDASRTGDDVSGKEWERTRRTGLNTLAFRMPQHKIFYSLDADCVAVTPDVPWSMSRQWLEVVATSGSVLLISPDPKAIGKEQQSALREAFERCVHRPNSEPLDWIETRSPQAWRSSVGPDTYNWVLEEGESPFPIGIQRGSD
jgi:alpha-galactosidase